MMQPHGAMDRVADQYFTEYDAQTAPLLTLEGIRAWHRDRYGPPTTVTPTAPHREVSWRRAHEYLWPVVTRVSRGGALPIVGTIDWAELDDDDPRKVGSVFVAAGLHALHLELDQAARVAGSREVSTAADWRAISRQTRDRAAFLEENSWADRRGVA